MKRLIILHSNDIHGETRGLAQIATLVDRIRASNPGVPVLYVDAGDSQDHNADFSKRTRGIGMYHLLRVAGCQAATVGNKSLKRYGMAIIEYYAAAAQFPLLIANVFMPDQTAIPSTQATTIFDLGEWRLGMVGVTADTSKYIYHHQLHTVPASEVLQTSITQLRAAGADAIVVLSHMGLLDDYQLARGLRNTVPLIIGGHYHALLPQGEQVGDVRVVQAGSYAEYLGRVDLRWDGQHLAVERVTVIRITDDIPPAQRVLTEVKSIMKTRDSNPKWHNE